MPDAAELIELRELARAGIHGRDALSPRGVPVGHTRLEIGPAEWRSPVEVAIEGLAPALPLFG